MKEKLLKFYKTKYFVVLAFLVLTFLGYHFAFLVFQEIISNFGPEDFIGVLTWSYNLVVSGFTLLLVSATGLSIYGIRKSDEAGNQEYKKGFYITATLSILVFIAFTVLIIFNI